MYHAVNPVCNNALLQASVTIYVNKLCCMHTPKLIMIVILIHIFYGFTTPRTYDDDTSIEAGDTVPNNCKFLLMLSIGSSPLHPWGFTTHYLLFFIRHPWPGLVVCLFGLSSVLSIKIFSNFFLSFIFKFWLSEFFRDKRSKGKRSQLLSRCRQSIGLSLVF